MKLKYIVTNHGPILFGEGHSHAEIGHNQIVLGAGFVNLTAVCHNDNPQLLVECYGESVSLKLPSRCQQDEEVIDRLLNYH